jgi:DNA (cytosine-5)-methyltransferase 1
MKALDLFCGCGGLSLGFQKAGFEIVGAYDAWQLAIDTYNANMSHHAKFFDLGNVQGFLKEVQKKKFGIIFGGPPCQDFSSAGHRKERDRANLTMSYAEIIAESKPLYFVMENVARIRNSKAYQQARSLFVSAGYGLTEIILDANYCGVPQIRKRFFCIGTLNESDGFMEDILQKSMGKKRMTVRDYFGSELNVENYYRHPRNYNRRGVFSVNEPSMTIRGVNRPIPDGYKGHHGDTAPIDKSLRALTTQERSRIQTFPKDFKWLGSKTDTEQMIGNAVPVNLAEFVAACIAEFDNLRTAKKKDA